MAPGTTLDDPVDETQRPDLQGLSHEISEYLKDQSAHDLFSYLLKELLTKQPEDPLDHMLQCLQTEYPLGPLRVFVSSPPGVGRSSLARRLAEHFGLEYISAGELLRESGVKTVGLDSEAERETAELVVERVSEANNAMQGFVLDGFPRTRFQTSFLKERSIVPSHVIVLQATTEQILRRNKLMEEGEIEFDERGHVPLEVLEENMRLHSCHSSSALETYTDKACMVQALERAPEQVWSEVEAAVRALPRSRGPQPPPRILLLGPRGIGVKEHASRLAARLGAVFVDGQELNKDFKGPSLKQRKSVPVSATSPAGFGLQKISAREARLARLRLTNQETTLSKTSMDVSKTELASLAQKDKLGMVGVRLRHPDCAKQGWVMCGFPETEELARNLCQDSHLAPIRVIVLDALAETCVQRLRSRLIDTGTGKVWTSLPSSEATRKRLQRQKEDQPVAVREANLLFYRSLDEVLEGLSAGDRCMRIKADGPPAGVHQQIIEFVERPLPLPPRA